MVLELAPSRAFPRHSEGAFLERADGALLFAYTRFSGGGLDHSAAEIVCLVSKDQGRTWSRRARQLVPNRSACNVMSVSLLRLQDGRIALFSLEKNGPQDCRPVVRFSSDEGRTFSAAARAATAPGYHVVNNDRVIQLRSGRLVLPSALHRSRLDITDPNDWRGFDLRGLCLFSLSDDGGRTWREAKSWWALPMPSGNGLQEPGVIELSDGRLFAWCRTDVGHQYGLWSSDGGETWSPPTPTTFASPCSPLSMKREPVSGALVAVWNDTSGRLALPRPGRRSAGRTPLVAAVSRDEGATWGAPLPLEVNPDRGYCYTAMHFTGDGHLLLAYCAGGEGQCGVLDLQRLKRVPVSALLAASGR